MPKKFAENTKKAAGNAKKAANDEARNQKIREEEDRTSAETWSKGAKVNAKKEAEESKRQAQLVKKAENARILEEERKSLPSKPIQKERGDEKKAMKRAESLDAFLAGRDNAAPALAASNIDDALDLLSLTEGRKGDVGKEVDRHPERRQKAALAAFEEKRLPELKVERPGLRLQQYKEVIFKEFQKSPENPFNQLHATHNMKKSELNELAASERQKTEQRLTARE